jgi:hypothetical protein
MRSDSDYNSLRFCGRRPLREGTISRQIIGPSREGSGFRPSDGVNKLGQAPRHTADSSCFRVDRSEPVPFIHSLSGPIVPIAWPEAKRRARSGVPPDSCLRTEGPAVQR